MVETVEYEVLRKLDKVEIRRYPKLTIAKAEGHGNGGFDLLFRFITGENRQKTKVKMTAPVVSERIEMTAPVLSDQGSLAFVMPKGYTTETTPEPTNKKVKIAEIPERLVAALRFSGRWTESSFHARSKELHKELTTAKVRTKGNVFAMLYNAPFTPWFMRRNEVAIEVELERQT